MPLVSVCLFVCLCWGLTSQSTIFQSCRDGATASWVINQYFRGVKCLAQGHNTAEVGFEPPTSCSGVRHSATEPPRSPLGSVKSTFTLLFWHKILIPNFKPYCHEGLCMSQHTGSHKNSLNLLDEKYLNGSHWPMHRIRLLECRAYFFELPSTFKMQSFIRKTSFPFILVQETAVKLLINSSLHSAHNYFILQAFQASTK